MKLMEIVHDRLPLGDLERARYGQMSGDGLPTITSQTPEPVAFSDPIRIADALEVLVQIAGEEGYAPCPACDAAGGWETRVDVDQWIDVPCANCDGKGFLREVQE